MTSSLIELDRPITTPSPNGRHPRRHRGWIIALAAGAGTIFTLMATGAAYVATHAGNEPMTSGVHSVKIYTVDDGVSTVVAPKDRPGTIGRFIGMCDADSYYMEADGVGNCFSLNGSLGTIHATGTPHGVEISARDAAKLRAIVQKDDHGSPEKSTRVVLEYDEGWAGLVKVADLNGGGPVTGSLIK